MVFLVLSASSIVFLAPRIIFVTVSYSSLVLLMSLLSLGKLGSRSVISSSALSSAPT